jgi:plastocyanin
MTNRFAAMIMPSAMLIAIVLLCAGGVAATDEPGGTLQGQVRFDGTPVKEAVVYLVREGDTAKPRAMELTIKQDGLVFHPSFAVVTPGSTIRFENHDLEMHNVKSDSPANRFDLGVHMPGQIREVVLKRPGPVLVRCRLHDRMTAIIYVTPSADFAVTDAAGRFAIHNLTPGSYHAALWHPRLTDDEMQRTGRVIRIDDHHASLAFELNPSSPPDAGLSDLSHRDWRPVIEQIGQRLEKALTRWKDGRQSSATRMVMQAYAQLYGGSGLKEAITQRLGDAQSAMHEKRFSRLVREMQSETLSPELEADWSRERATLLEELQQDARALGP